MITVAPVLLSNLTDSAITAQARGHTSTDNNLVMAAATLGPVLALAALNRSEPLRNLLPRYARALTELAFLGLTTAIMVTLAVRQPGLADLGNLLRLALTTAHVSALAFFVHRAAPQLRVCVFLATVWLLPAALVPETPAQLRGWLEPSSHLLRAIPQPASIAPVLALMLAGTLLRPSTRSISEA